MTNFIYPAELYHTAKERWNKGFFAKLKKDLPDREIFKELVETAFHASFITEEKRRISFRVIYTTKKEIEKRKLDSRSQEIIEFETPRKFGVGELVKLAPATDPTHVLIGVQNAKNSSALEIWGLLESGTSWWDFTRHEADSATHLPPDGLILSSQGPGQVSLSRIGFPIATLNQGKIGFSPHVLWQSPIVDFLSGGQKSLYTEVCTRLKRDKYESSDYASDDDYPENCYLYFLERLFNRIREKGHGGTVIIIPDKIKTEDTRLQDRIRIKYLCSYDAFAPIVQVLEWHSKYYDAYFGFDKRKTITKKEFRNYIHAKNMLEEAEENVKRAASFLSSLSAVDGAVVITDKLRLLGFGAEITAVSPSLKRIKVMTNCLKNESEHRDIELFGTRHRSAFRFCSSFEDSIAVVVSSDGDIRVAKRIGSNVVLWPSVSVTILGM